MNNQTVSAFVTAANIRFMLLHGGKSDDNIRNFFAEVYDLYVKVSLSCDVPFLMYPLSPIFEMVVVSYELEL